MDVSPLILLYEPRMLFRDGLIDLLTGAGFQVIPCLSLEQLTEEICVQSSTPRIVLTGVRGMGNTLDKLLRMIYHIHALGVATIAYLSDADSSIERLLLGIGVECCIHEAYLNFSLLPRLRTREMTANAEQRLSLVEINVLLDYAAGMPTREIASRRGCNYKTVFTHKRNAAIALNMKSKKSWLKLMTRIAQLSSSYR